jgi:hypothetical protein
MKVILVTDDGKQIEFDKFLLYAFDNTDGIPFTAQRGMDGIEYLTAIQNNIEYLKEQYKANPKIFKP